jgi:2-oxoglutarate dehydrogenase E2 component (dihydrolipoamide succinyltransferase)
MATRVIMPQLGESVIEGTVGRWLAAEGQPVKQYDPLLQVTTDKVDTEISAPATGVLLKVYVPEGQTVARGTLLALIGAPDEAVPDSPPAAAEPASGGTAVEAGSPPAEPAAMVSPLTPVAQRMALEHGLDLTQVPGSGPGGRVTKEDVEAHLARQVAGARHPGAVAPETPGRAAPGAWPLAGGGTLGFISPAVARLAAENGVDLRQIAGTGEGGRITRKDVQNFLETGRGAPGPQAAPRLPNPPFEDVAPAGEGELPAWERPGTGSLFKPTEEALQAPTVPPDQPPAAGRAPGGAEIRPLSAMRRSIARHMVSSKETSAHVTTVMEADMTRVVQAHERLGEAFAQQGARLTYTPFLIQAIIAGLRAVPEANSTYQEDHLAVHRQMNIGVAVALPEGLIVPVIHDADEKSLLGLARAVNDLAERARAGRLVPDDVQGGTFTLTNHGTSGSLLATPIINQPQAGILGVGAIQKRPVVISRGSGLLPGPDDTLAIRPMVYLSFSFDHRILDGAGADRFLGAVKDCLERYA